MTSDVRSPGSGGRWVQGVWTPAKDVKRAESKASLESGARGLHIPFRWEVAAYVTLVVVALLLRTWGLGDRAVHHDESLHGFFAWNLYEGRDYLHNPLTHGMFLFHIISGSFFLFGDSDFTLRLPMALFGTGLVAAPLLLRNRMGQIATLAAALMITFSPALIYFSRFARNDIFIAVFTLMLIGAMFRYIDEKKDRWLYVGAAAIALGFTTKENMYMVVAIVGGYLLWRTAPEIWEWLMGRKGLKDFSPAAGFLVLVGGLSLPMFAAGASILDDSLGLNLSAANGSPGLATGEPEAGTSLVVAIVITVTLMLIGWGFGLLWKPKAWTISWAVFALIFALMFTNFFTHPGGIGTGVWQSLGYWLEQQDVHRGAQPWYYYFMISSAYEFLPFVMTLGTAVFIAYRTGVVAWAFLAAAVVLLSFGGYQSIQFEHEWKDAQVLIPNSLGILMLAAFAMYAKTTSFKRFALFWTIFTFTAYTIAGEKMPWLLTHITLPFIIVAAIEIGDIIMHIKWQEALRRGNWMLLFGVPIFFLLLWRLIFINIDSDFVGFFSLFLLLTVLGLMLVGQQWLGSQIGHRAAWGSAALVFALMMFGFTFRAGWIASFVNKDVPREILVYTQTSQDIRQVTNEIQLAGNLTGEGNAIELSIDTADSFAWPWHWYLRGYTNARFTDFSADGASADKAADIAVIGAGNNSKVRLDYVSGYSEGRRIQHRAWFPEGYKNMQPGQVWDTIWDRERWRGSVDFFIYRNISAEIGSVDSFVYFNDEIPISPLN